MAKSDLTAINAKTISVNGTPIAGSAQAYGPYTTFDQLDADVVVALNGTVIQGQMTSALAYTNMDHLNVLSGLSLAETVKYGTASTPASNNATGPIGIGAGPIPLPGGGGTPTPTPGPTGYDVFVLAGQSNMISRYGPIDSSLDATDTDIMQYGFDGQSVVLAANPLDHQDETANTVGMGITFAKAYKAAGLLATGRKILLVPVAKGGTGFNTGFWRAGGNGDAPAIARTNAAMAQGSGTNSLKGILWHQGESDQSFTQSQYETDLDALIARWRSSMTGATANTPFVCGGLLVGGTQTGSGVSAALSATPSRVSKTGYAASTSLTDGGDNLHFSAASQRTFGGRYFSAYQSAINNTITPTVPGQVTGLTATPGNGQAMLSWTQPASGGSAITDYRIEYKLSSDSTYTTFNDGVSTSTTATVTGLNAASYDFRVSAINAIGTGSPSAVASTTPSPATAPFINQTYSVPDGTSLASYTDDTGNTHTVSTGTATINGGELYGTTVPAQAVINRDPATAAIQIDFDLVVKSSAGNCYVRFHVQDDSNYYYCGMGGTQGVQFGKIVGGTATNLYSAGVAASAGTFGLRQTIDANGNVAFYVDKKAGAGYELRFSGQDTTPALQPKGRVGFRFSGTAGSATVGAHIDNLKVYDL